MSLKEHADALLEGFDAPIFPGACRVLRNQLDRRSVNGHLISVNGHLIKDIAAQVMGFVEATRLTTSDGYVWFWGMTFETDGGRVCVLVPWSHDFDTIDGSSADRSIAVYLSGASERAAAAILDRLVIVAGKTIDRMIVEDRVRVNPPD